MEQLGRKLVDMLNTFARHANAPHATSADRCVIICGNNAAYYDIVRAGNSLLDADERYRLHN